MSEIIKNYPRKIEVVVDGDYGRKYGFSFLNSSDGTALWYECPALEGKVKASLQFGWNKGGFPTVWVVDWTPSMTSHSIDDVHEALKYEAESRYKRLGYSSLALLKNMNCWREITEELNDLPDGGEVVK